MALIHLEKILATANKADGVQLMVYKTFAEYYKALGMHKEALEYDELYSEAFSEKTKTTKKIFNKLIEKSQEAQNQVRKEQNTCLYFQ